MGEFSWSYRADIAPAGREPRSDEWFNLKLSQALVIQVAGDFELRVRPHPQIAGWYVLSSTSAARLADWAYRPERDGADWSRMRSSDSLVLYCPSGYDAVLEPHPHVSSLLMLSCVDPSKDRLAQLLADDEADPADAARRERMLRFDGMWDAFQRIERAVDARLGAVGDEVASEVAEVIADTGFDPREHLDQWSAWCVGRGLDPFVPMPSPDEMATRCAFYMRGLISALDFSKTVARLRVDARDASWIEDPDAELPAGFDPALLAGDPAPDPAPTAEEQAAIDEVGRLQMFPPWFLRPQGRNTSWSHMTADEVVYLDVPMGYVAVIRPHEDIEGVTVLAVEPREVSS